MAAKVTAESVLEDISRRHLECQICMDRIKEPKMLECLHSFCLECLQQFAEKHCQYNKKITCPVCRSQTSIARKGVSQLKTDFKLTSLLNEIEQHEADLQSQQVTQPSHHGSVSKCRRHTDKEALMFCDTCKQLICITCVLKDHRMHQVIEPHEVLESCKQNANELFVKLEQHLKRLKITLQDIGMSQNILDTTYTATKAKISKKADEEIAREVSRIREEEKKLNEVLDHVYKDRANVMQTAKANNVKELLKSQNMKVAVSQLMDKVNIFENLKVLEKLLRELKEYTEIPPTKLPPGLGYIVFEEDQKSLGKVGLQQLKVEAGIANMQTSDNA